MHLCLRTTLYRLGGMSHGNIGYLPTLYSRKQETWEAQPQNRKLCTPDGVPIQRKETGYKIPVSPTQQRGTATTPYGGQNPGHLLSGRRDANP